MDKPLKHLIKKLEKGLEIVYESPDMLHPNSDYQTISDVANFLEDKYHLLQNFSIYIKPKLLKKLSEYILSNKNNWDFLLSEWLKGEWRDYIVEQLHHIKTKLSQMEDREAFINTGAYYKTISVKIKFL
ncbi:TPA: hypothetical protein RTG63_001664 [Campylobacter jejuni]|nr:hypothetical protein [Campylobacter jejuni]